MGEMERLVSGACGAVNGWDPPPPSLWRGRLYGTNGTYMTGTYKSHVSHRSYPLILRRCATIPNRRFAPVPGLR